MQQITGTYRREKDAQKNYEYTVTLSPSNGGFIWSALKTGFEFGDGMWPETWKAVRGKKNDDGEQISD